MCCEDRIAFCFWCYQANEEAQWVQDFLVQSQGWEDSQLHYEWWRLNRWWGEGGGGSGGGERCFKCVDMVRLWVHGIQVGGVKCGGMERLWVHGIHTCRGILKSLEDLNNLWWSRHWDILLVVRLEVTRIETMEIVQRAAIGPLEVVCGARVWYIMTYQGESFDFNVY